MRVHKFGIFMDLLGRKTLTGKYGQEGFRIKDLTHQDLSNCDNHDMVGKKPLSSRCDSVVIVCHDVVVVLIAIMLGGQDVAMGQPRHGRQLTLTLRVDYFACLTFGRFLVLVSGLRVHPMWFIRWCITPVL